MSPYRGDPTDLILQGCLLARDLILELPVLRLCRAFMVGVAW